MIKLVKNTNLVAVFVLVAILVLGFNGLDIVRNRVVSSDYETLCSSIQKAVTECYILEGMYPPSVEYLEQHYSIQIDREKYAVFYEGFASNMAPNITVIQLEEQE